jgi:prophage regulatory protein
MKETTKTTTKDRLGFASSLAEHPELSEIIRRCRNIVSTRILRLPIAKAKMGHASSTFWAAVKKGELPKSVAISVRSVGWLESELDAVIAARLFSSRTGQPIDIIEFVRVLTRPRIDQELTPTLSSGALMGCQKSCTPFALQEAEDIQSEHK